MDRFSPRLAASLIEDRHRHAADARRFAELAPMESDRPATARQTTAVALERALRALPRPFRIWTGAR